MGGSEYAKNLHAPRTSHPRIARYSYDVVIGSDERQSGSRGIRLSRNRAFIYTGTRPTSVALSHRSLLAGIEDSRRSRNGNFRPLLFSQRKEKGHVATIFGETDFGHCGGCGVPGFVLRPPRTRIATDSIALTSPAAFFFESGICTGSGNQEQSAPRGQAAVDFLGRAGAASGAVLHWCQWLLWVPSPTGSGLGYDETFP